MDTRAHELAGPPGHGLGLAAQRAQRPPPLRAILLALAAACLLAGVSGGLARLGVPLTPAPGTAQAHGALMLGFLGTVIALERAIAFGGLAAFGVPLVAALGTLLPIAGAPAAGNGLLLAAPVLLVALSVAIARRQLALHTALLVVAAAAWAAGNVLYVAGAASMIVTAWWFAFLVLTVAAERLELTRLMPRRAPAHALFGVAVALMLGGAAVLSFDAHAGSVVYGAGLAATALWAVTFDIARRTLRTHGFARYAAYALLAGYAWLAVGGAAWAMLPWHGAVRDLALHAVALGFVISMIFAHAPLMIPVILRVPMRYTPWLFVPLALLHASLVLRLGFGFGDAQARQWGGVTTVVALAWFVATLLAAGQGRTRGRGNLPHSNAAMSRRTMT